LGPCPDIKQKFLPLADFRPFGKETVFINPGIYRRGYITWKYHTNERFRGSPMDDNEIRRFVREISNRRGTTVSEEEFEDLVRIIRSFWADVETESERVSRADKETIILYFNLMVDCLCSAYMQKYRMDAGHAHSKAYEEITSTALNLIHEKGLIKDFFTRFETIPLRDGVYKEFLTEKTLQQENVKRRMAAGKDKTE
jgi:hypothetical protein